MIILLYSQKIRRTNHFRLPGVSLMHDDHFSMTPRHHSRHPHHQARARMIPAVDALDAACVGNLTVRMQRNPVIDVQTRCSRIAFELDESRSADQALAAPVRDFRPVPVIRSPIQQDDAILALHGAPAIDIGGKADFFDVFADARIAIITGHHRLRGGNRKKTR